MDTPSVAQDSSSPNKPQVRLVDVPVRDQNEALQVMVAFLNLAQRRGCYTIDESAKIFECVKLFQGTDKM